MITCLPVIAVILASPVSDKPIVQPSDPPSMQIQIDGKRFMIAPVKKVAVKGEEHVLGDDQPRLWSGGISPKLVLGPVDTGTRLPLALDPSSVVVRSTDGTVYEEGKDYVLERYWGGFGRKTDGRIKADETVLIDYAVSLQRIDTVQVSGLGVVSIKMGKPARVCPEVPETDAGCKRVANIFLPFNAASVPAEQIFNIDDPKKTWQNYVKVQGRDYLAGTRDLLKQGQKITVVCYGDSVTQGGSASSPDKNFVGLLRSELNKLYPKAGHEVINAGIGGSNTDQRLPNLDKEVLSFDPDLVVVEFVNDMGFNREKLKSNYFQLIDRIRARNPKTEIIILTPHFTRPDWMGNFHNSCSTLREITAEKKVGLGDTAVIWGSLGKLGIPYQTLLANEINHPNDLGHSFFCETILALLK